jgi:pyruvate formate lyase activating enzyme
MFLAGYQKLTLIDYPGKIAATAFTQGCNFNCPFCHNPDLIQGARKLAKNNQQILQEKAQDFIGFLETRQGKLEGVCITGGEPTLQPDLAEYLHKIKNLGFWVKLDSQGSRPEVLESLLELGLVDYIAMDIKHTPEKYSQATGVPVNSKKMQKIKQSVKLIQESGIDYEFRTTVVPGIHQEEDLEEIGEWIQGSRHYYLQQFREVKLNQEDLAESAKNAVPVDLEKVKAELEEKYLPHVEIRWGE